MMKTTHNNNNINSKKLHIETLRVIACFFVVFNHTNDTGFFLFSKYPPSTIQYWIYLFISVFCKLSVPLYFAISGALLIPKDDDFMTLFFKRILKMVLSLFAFSVIYFLYNNKTHLTLQSINDFFIMFYVKNTNYHLWFLYSYLAFLFSLPFLRILARNMKDKHFLYMFILAFVFVGILPILEYIFNHGKYTLNSDTKVSWLINQIVFYPCLGYYMENKLDIAKIKKYMPALWIANVICIFVCCVATFYKQEITGICDESNSQSFHSCFVYVNVFTVYITVKYIFQNFSKDNLLSKIIISIGNCSFGIYLFHAIFKDLFYNKLLLFFKHIISNNMLSSMFSCVVIMFISHLITLLVKKLPFINNLV